MKKRLLIIIALFSFSTCDTQLIKENYEYFEKDILYSDTITLFSPVRFSQTVIILDYYMDTNVIIHSMDTFLLSNDMLIIRYTRAKDSLMIASTKRYYNDVE